MTRRALKKAPPSRTLSKPCRKPEKAMLPVPDYRPETEEERKFREYQTKYLEAIVADLRAGIDKVLLVLPTGAGKSLVVAAAVAELKGTANHVTHVLVAVPQTHVKDSFCGLVGSWKIRKNKQLCLDQLFGLQQTAEQVIEFVTSSNPVNFAATMCHVTLSEEHWERLLVVDGVVRKDALRGKVLVIDEGHHCSTDPKINVLSAFAEFWVRHGGQVLKATATPFRMDSVVVDDTWRHVYRRTLAEHREAGFCPKEVVFRFVELEGLRANNEKEWYGEDVVGNLPYREIVAAWRDGRKGTALPPAMFFVPPGASEKKAEALVKELSKYTKVLNGVGTGPGAQSRFQEGLKDGGREYGAVVVCGRGNEATDWPKCSHTYIIGAPSANMGRVEQRAGRAGRMKSANHPWKEESIVTYLIPGKRSKDFNQELLEGRYLDTALLIGVFSASMEVGVDYWNSGTPAKCNKAKRDQHMAIDGAGGLDTQEQAGAERCLALLGLELEDDATVADYLKAIQQKVDGNSWDEEQAANVLDVLKDRLARADEKLEKKLKAATRKADRDTVYGDGGDDEVDKEELRIRYPRSVIRLSRRAYWDEVMSSPAVMRRIVPSTSSTVFDVACRLTGEDCRQLVARLVANKKVPLSERSIIEAATNFLNVNKAPPNKRSGDATPYFGLSVRWNCVDQCLRNGGRGLPGGSSLYQLLVAHGLKGGKIDWDAQPLGECADSELAENLEISKEAVQKQRSDRGIPAFNLAHELTTDSILDDCLRYFKKHKRYPTQRDGAKWKNIHQALRNGHRGLPGGSSLHQLLVYHGFKKETKLEVGSLTEIQIVKAAKVYHKKHGKWPSLSSVDAARGFDFKVSWRSINSALRGGFRGLPGGSSLHQLLVDHGLIDEVTNLTEVQIVKAAKAHHKKHGKYPSSISGDASGFFGFKATWMSIHSALKGGCRGLPGGSSLSLLKKKHGLK